MGGKGSGNHRGGSHYKGRLDEQIKELHSRGYTDRVIEAELGCSHNHVRAVREKYGLPPATKDSKRKLNRLQKDLTNHQKNLFEYLCLRLHQAQVAKQELGKGEGDHKLNRQDIDNVINDIRRNSYDSSFVHDDNKNND